MQFIKTEDLTPASLSGSANHQTYCGLDSCLTLEVFEEITATHRPPAIYDFERALQGPYLEIMLRGFRVDEMARAKARTILHARLEVLQHRLNALAQSVWGRGLNPRSPKELKDFFYSHMRLPEVWISQKGVKKLSTNREALEKLDQYIYARPFISLILTTREVGKQLSVFEDEIDPDGRFRTSYNIAGTETGRPSSSGSAFGTGGNAQNIAPSLRYPFVADYGYKLCVIDLEQVEARDEGFFIGCLFDDWTFLDSCESGDLHTNNARLIWPEMGWTGDLQTDRILADGNFYREFSFRDMAKRGSHLSNYMGTAWTAGRALKVPQNIMEDFQARYCRGRTERILKSGSVIPPISPAFPGIPRYWQWCAQELQTRGWLETPFGRKRHFFGDPRDDATLREAIAFMPQSTTADRMNLGLLRVWRQMPQVQLLAQTYDSITFQFREKEDEGALIAEALALIQVELFSPANRSYIVPGEAKVGWNWGNQVTKDDIDRARASSSHIPRLNEDGLRKWKPGTKDGRTRKIGLQRHML